MFGLTASSSPGQGSLGQKLRLATGAVLFTFVATHLLNHALGLVSVNAMEEVQVYRTLVTRSLPGTIVLGASLATHVALALYKFVRRRTWRMSGWEAVQLGFGLAIPVLLLRHVFATRLPYELYGTETSYHFALTVMWPGEAWQQLALIVLAWVHGCIGLHFWLRLQPWYRPLMPIAYAFAVLVPVLGFAGFVVAARALHAAKETYDGDLTAEQFATLQQAIDTSVWFSLGIVGAALALRLGRTLLDQARHRIRISYLDGRTVLNQVGPTLLEISRSYGIPHASVCGGRARCSTCRVRVLEGIDDLPPPNDAERRVLDRIGAGAHVRLACQMRPTADLTVATLLPARRVLVDDTLVQDRYVWGVEQEITIAFADLRGFTSLSENRLAFDVVFLLNQYLARMSDAVEDAGGYVDKVIGDGVMAIFGIGKSVEQGARESLLAARAMGGVLDALNRVLLPDLKAPLNVGIGINTGQAILGRVGVREQRGAFQRMTALGDTVNTASRLESACKELKVQLIVSGRTLEAAGLAIGEAGRNEKVQLRGKLIELDVAAYPRALDAPVAAPGAPASARVPAAAGSAPQAP